MAARDGVVAASPAGGPADGDRRLRSDAERNRRRILRAATEVFTERGLDATLDDVARHAGVGVGTVYRRFPDKETLVQELFTDRVDALVADTEKACAAADPWTGLTWYLGHVAETFSADLGFRQLMMFGTYGAVCSRYARDRMRPVGRACPGGRAGPRRPGAYRHPVHPAHGDQRRRARQGGPPRRVAPLPYADPRRPAPSASRYHRDAGARARPG
jgi:AcrR family transcriptional regulator